MDSQDSPRPGRTSPITISAPATARGRVPLTARSAASGRSVQYVGDANPDTLVSSQPNRSANTDTSPAQNGQPSNPSTFDDGTVPPPPTFSRSSAAGEGYTSPRGDLPSQDHADPAPPQANPLANALAQVADTLVDTCCVWGGFGRFRPASTWRHNPVPFISQVPGGYYAGLTPPFIPVFVSFYFAYTTTANG